MTDTSNGIAYERTVSRALSTQGIKVVTFKDFSNNRKALFRRGEPFAVAQGEYRNFCDKVGRADYILYVNNNTTGGWRAYRIECRHQASPGSVSEKLPKLSADASQNTFERTILVASPWLADYYANEMEYLKAEGVLVVRFDDDNKGCLEDVIRTAVGGGEL